MPCRVFQNPWLFHEQFCQESNGTHMTEQACLVMIANEIRKSDGFLLRRLHTTNVSVAARAVLQRCYHWVESGHTKRNGLARRCALDLKEPRVPKAHRQAFTESLDLEEPVVLVARPVTVQSAIYSTAIVLGVSWEGCLPDPKELKRIGWLEWARKSLATVVRANWHAFRGMFRGSDRDFVADTIAGLATSRSPAITGGDLIQLSTRLWAEIQVRSVTDDKKLGAMLELSAHHPQIRTLIEDELARCLSLTSSEWAYVELAPVAKCRSMARAILRLAESEKPISYATALKRLSPPFVMPQKTIIDG